MCHRVRRPKCNVYIRSGHPSNSPLERQFYLGKCPFKAENSTLISVFINNIYQLAWSDPKRTKILILLLQQSEFNLGIQWQDGKFIRTGAKLLDDKLINEPLHWLKEKSYESVLTPFSKGLELFLQAQKRPELLADVITDMYESIEALAKFLTGRPEKDLSANRELFLKRIKASESYKIILKDYIDYANEFRHAMEEGKSKPSLSQSEAESFVYLTGLFIRLAIAGEESSKSI